MGVVVLRFLLAFRGSLIVCQSVFKSLSTQGPKGFFMKAFQRKKKRGKHHMKTILYTYERGNVKVPLVRKIYNFSRQATVEHQKNYDVKSKTCRIALFEGGLYMQGLYGQKKPVSVLQ